MKTGSSIELDPRDYKSFVPTALKGFDLRPNSARIIGSKLPDGIVKFTYTLEWLHTGPEPKKQTTASRTKKKRRGSTTSMNTPRYPKVEDEDDSDSEIYNKKGIIDVFDDTAVPKLLSVCEVDGTLYQVVDNDGCILRLQGNNQFNELMRMEAIQQGLYHPSCYTPAADGTSTIAPRGGGPPQHMPVIIRKMYFDEWQRFRKLGDKYNGLWKGIIYREPTRPKVDMNLEPDWMVKYPELWPSCKIIRDGVPLDEVSERSLNTEDDWSEYHSRTELDKAYRKEKAALLEKKAARKRWVDERRRVREEEKKTKSLSQKERDELQKAKLRGLNLVIHGHLDTTRKPVCLRLTVKDPNKAGELKKRELMLPGQPKAQLSKLLVDMCEQSGWKRLLPSGEKQLLANVYYKTKNNKRRRIQNVDQVQLQDVPKIDGIWRLYVDYK